MTNPPNKPISNEDQTVGAACWRLNNVRMSTEHQQYSTSNQDDVIRDYAAKRGYEIVRTYADEGKSGLNVPLNVPNSTAVGNDALSNSRANAISTPPEDGGGLVITRAPRYSATSGGA